MTPSVARKPCTRSKSSPGRPHGDRQRRAVQADLQRLLRGDRVGAGGVLRAPDAQHRRPAGDSSHAQDGTHAARSTVSPWNRGRRTPPSCWPAARRRGWAGRPSRSCEVGGRTMLDDGAGRGRRRRRSGSSSGRRSRCRPTCVWCASSPRGGGPVAALRAGLAEVAHRRRGAARRRPAVPHAGAGRRAPCAAAPATACWSSTTAAATSTCSGCGGRRRCARPRPTSAVRRRCGGCSPRSPSAATAPSSSRARRRRGPTATPPPTSPAPGPRSRPPERQPRSRHRRSCRSSAAPGPTAPRRRRRIGSSSAADLARGVRPADGRAIAACRQVAGLARGPPPPWTVKGLMPSSAVPHAPAPCS